MWGPRLAVAGCDSPLALNFLELAENFKAALDSWATPAPLSFFMLSFSYWVILIWSGSTTVLPLPNKSYISSQVHRSKGYSSHIESWGFAHDRHVEHEEFHLNPDGFLRKTLAESGPSVFCQGSHMRHGSWWWERRGVWAVMIIPKAEVNPFWDACPYWPSSQVVVKLLHNSPKFELLKAGLLASPVAGLLHHCQWSVFMLQYLNVFRCIYVYDMYIYIYNIVYVYIYIYAWVFHSCLITVW